ncbi:hypothetical protein E0L36_10055 [Streptomyces sp. AJS327]|nr:hypothetical protein [Streptomyces sp. AJS327]
MDDPEARLRETLDSLAQNVTPAPDAYARASSEWRRRDRRRRLLMLVLAVVIIAVADLVGLWALHSLSESDSPPGDQRVDVIVQP